MENKNYINHLKALAKEYDLENISLLIGAGFSKNALIDFPSWDQLLSDMIIELYNSEFKDNSHKIIIKNPTKRILNKNFKQEKIQEIIAKVGYLEIVSLFLKKRGMREAIEIYIENRTPYADNNKFIIPYKQKTIDIDNNSLSLHEKVLEGKWEQIYTTNYDNLLEYTAKIKSKEWQEITNGYDLSFSDTKKNIIKIHGSLRSIEERSENKNFVFDNCHDHCYIITKEDYENYPVQHEAFTQLMRISLLKGVFLLIGFSGNDPNFLSWLKWIKDILVKKQKNDGEPRVKVYVITIDDKEVNSELELYYANHHISIIPLRNNYIKEEIKAKGNSPKELINNLLEYLYNSNKINTNNYTEFWKNIYRNKTSIDTDYLLNLSKEIGFKKEINYQSLYLSKINLPDKILTIDEIQLALLAISDIGSTFDLYGFKDTICNSINDLSFGYKELYSKIKNRNLVLINSKEPLDKLDKKDLLYLNETLKYAFNLDFIGLRLRLEKWNPEGIYNINKASLMSLFDVQLAKDQLLKYINNEKDTDQNKFLAIQTINFLKDWNEKNYSTVNYINQNIDSFYDIRDELLYDIITTKKKVKPFGTSSDDFVKSKIKEAIRLLNFFIDSSPQLTSKYYVNIDSSDWYQLFKELYLHYPYPCFYFSLQFNNDTILRISQDYAYADDLKLETEFFLLKSLNNLIDKNVPQKIFLSTFLMCSNLLCAVNPTKWEKKFIQIWDQYLIPIFQDNDLKNAIFTFVKAGLPQLRSTKNKIKILVDCISYREKNFNNSIDLLYYLKINKSKIDTDSNTIINNFIKKISKPFEISIAGNIYKILSLENINIVSQKINFFLTSNNTIPDNTIYACAYFLSITNNDIQALKKYIIENKSLWDTGIGEKSATLPDFIKLSRFERYINWSNDEVQAIYLKLKNELNKLLNSRYYKEDDLLFKNTYTDLLYEMSLFIKKNKTHLSKEQDLSTVVNSLKLELKNNRGFDVLNEGLVSDDQEQVYNSLSILYREIKESKIENYTYQLHLLVSRVINKRKEGLIYCFDYLDYFIKTYFVRKKIPDDLQESLILGVNQYNKDELIALNLDVPKMSKYLINLAEILLKKGSNSDGIEYWLKFKKEKRFN